MQPSYGYVSPNQIKFQAIKPGQILIGYYFDLALYFSCWSVFAKTGKQ